MTKNIKQILIRRDGQQYGPYSLEEVKYYLESGHILITDAAQAEGGDWLTVGKILTPSSALPNSNCPFCGVEIQDGAIKCEHCRENIAEETTAPSNDLSPDSNPVCRLGKVSWTVIPVLFAILVVAALVSFVLLQTHNPDASRHGSNAEATVAASEGTPASQKTTLLPKLERDDPSYVTSLVRKHEKSVDEGTAEWRDIDTEIRNHLAPTDSDSRVFFKLLVGLWQSPRHEYVFREDGTWSMLPAEPEVTHGHWRIEGNQYFDIADFDTPETHQYTIILLTEKDFVFTDGKNVFYEKRISSPTPVDLTVTPPIPVADKVQTVPKSSEEKRADWLEKAEAGDAYSQAIMGIKYRIGDGVPVDSKKAFKFSSDSSMQGNSLGTCNLGRLYEDGQGVEKDPKKASGFFSQAGPGLKRLADSGDSYAQVAFGWCLENGKGMEKSEREAVRWYRESAEQGNVLAQFNFAVSLENGMGTEKNQQEAVQWYRKAAEQGDSDAQFKLGLCLEYGTGTEKDEREAAKWFEKAGAQRNIDASLKASELNTKIAGEELAAQKIRRESISRQAKEQALLKDLQTSLKGGPEPDVIANILSDWLESDPSVEKFTRGGMDDLYNKGAVHNKLTGAGITNEYVRNVDGETIFFYDFRVEVKTPIRSETTGISCSFVKRGQKWYLYSVNGRRLEGF